MLGANCDHRQVVVYRSWNTPIADPGYSKTTIIVSKSRILVAGVLRRIGLHQFLSRYAGFAVSRIVKTRDYYARKHIEAGTGLEIGALHNPTKVVPGASVRYVDRLAHLQLVKNYSEFDATQIVRPDIIDDRFTLSNVANESQDYVIANHVLEHSPNPIQVLENWCRVTRPSGLLFVTVPIAETTFDKDRTLTTVDHIMDDYQLSRRGEEAAMEKRNLAHYREWVAISVPAMQKDMNVSLPNVRQTEIETKAEELRDCEAEIHFHTFSEKSFRQLLDSICEEVLPELSVKEYGAVGGEVVAVLRKADRAGAS